MIRLYLFVPLFIFILYNILKFIMLNVDSKIDDVSSSFKKQLSSNTTTHYRLHYSDNIFQKKTKLLLIKIDRYIVISNIQSKYRYGRLYNAFSHLMLSLILSSLFYFITKNIVLSGLVFLVPSIVLSLYSYFIIVKIRSKIAYYLMKWSVETKKEENFLEALDNILPTMEKNLKYYLLEYQRYIEEGDIEKAYNHLLYVFELLPNIQTMFQIIKIAHMKGGDVGAILNEYSNYITKLINKENEIKRKSSPLVLWSTVGILVSIFTITINDIFWFNILSFLGILLLIVMLYSYYLKPPKIRG